MEMTMEPPKIPFKQAYEQAGFGFHDASMVASHAQVRRVIVDMMISGYAPVERRAAEAVLAVLSKKSGRSWTLDMVDVRVEGGKA